MSSIIEWGSPAVVSQAPIEDVSSSGETTLVGGQSGEPAVTCDSRPPPEGPGGAFVSMKEMRRKKSSRSGKKSGRSEKNSWRERLGLTGSRTYNPVNPNPNWRDLEWAKEDFDRNFDEDSTGTVGSVCRLHGDPVDWAVGSASMESRDELIDYLGDGNQSEEEFNIRFEDQDPANIGRTLFPEWCDREYRRGW